MADLKALEERISRYIGDALIEFKSGTERTDWATTSMDMADEIIRWVADAVEDATSAALAGAEQATTDARLNTVWWAHDESDYDEWDANAMFADEQHAKEYALNAWMRSDLSECEEGHVDLATCEECQARKATYRDRLKWLKPSYGTWWELWLSGGEFDGKDMKTGIEVSPTKLHWPEALAADVPAAADELSCPCPEVGVFAKDCPQHGDHPDAVPAASACDARSALERIADEIPKLDGLEEERLAKALEWIHQVATGALTGQCTHGHYYLSTACNPVHDLHEPECGAAQRARGDNSHPHCKYCGAKCVCGCHTGGQVERAERVHADGCTLAADDPHHAGWCVLPDGSPARPTVVVLCGSGRFGQAFREANATETLAGRIVLSIGVTKADLEPLDADRRRQVEDALDDLHKRKIDLADEVFVLNVGGYIGSSTRSEIEYAQAHGKPIRWLEPVPAAGEAEVTPRIVERDLCWKPVIAEDGYAENCGLWEGHVPPCLLVCGDCREGRCHIPVRPPAPGVGDPDCGCARHNSSIAAWRLGEDDGAAAGSGEPTKAGGQP